MVLSGNSRSLLLCPSGKLLPRPISRLRWKTTSACSAVRAVGVSARPTIATAGNRPISSGAPRFSSDSVRSQLSQFAAFSKWLSDGT